MHGQPALQCGGGLGVEEQVVVTRIQRARQAPRLGGVERQRQSVLVEIDLADGAQAALQRPRQGLRADEFRIDSGMGLQQFDDARL